MYKWSTFRCTSWIYTMSGKTDNKLRHFHRSLQWRVRDIKEEKNLVKISKQVPSFKGYKHEKCD